MHFLGPFHVTRDGEPVTGFESNKVRALLAYLSIEVGHAHSRETLAGLLWPEQPEQTVRRNLSQALFNLRQAIHDHDAEPSFLQVTRRTVQFNPDSDHWLDTMAFNTHIAASETHPHPRLETCQTCIRRLEQAVELYRGSFLKGFFIDHSIVFEEWFLLQRERHHRLVLDALHHLTKHYERRRDYGRARRYAQRQVELEPWREQAHQQLMRLLARTGQRSAALAQYETCRRVLGEELGVKPTQETTALYSRIQAAGVTRWHNLPTQLTSFVGRKNELAEIAERLENPACRLLTLLGPGGIGKTRLALQAATEALDRFLNGVYFIPLASVSLPDFLVPTIADVLGLEFHGARKPTERLLDYLREKELLLVMDNLEHLLQGVGLLTDILRNAPFVKILVTSRERLNLRAEWLLDVQGLAYPENGPAVEATNYSAVLLFLQNAQRARAGFALSEKNLPHVSRICQLVEGIPLGIELASTWVRTLSCGHIAEEIQRDLDFLATSLRDVPERHRSMRAIFDHSCRLLSAAEKDVFYKLSVFSGEFQPEAAEQVAGASSSHLAVLMDKSLLHQISSGRYGIHELLRQYAAEKLYETPQVAEKTQHLHSAYYASFLYQRQNSLKGIQQKAALKEITAEIDNVRTGWNWAVERGATNLIGEYLDSLYHFYNVQSWFQEGKDAFEQVAVKLSASFDSDEDARTEDQNAILGKVLTQQARFLFHLGHYDKAKELSQAGLAISRRLGDWTNIAFSLLNLGFIFHVLGEYAEAKKSNEKSLKIFRDMGDQSGIAVCVNNLGNIARALGEYEKARQLYRECLGIRQKIKDSYGMAVALNNLGNIAEVLGEYLEARRLFQEGLTICQELGYQLGVAASLTNLGYVAWKLNECEDARQLHQESLDIKRELGDRRSITLSLINLGEVNCTQREYQESQQHFAEALKMALAIQAPPLIAETLIGIANLLSKTGSLENALELCAFILHRSIGRKEVQSRAQALFSELESQLPAMVVAAAQARGSAKKIEEMAYSVLEKAKGFTLRDL
jgi:predicted ATPase